MISSAPLSLSLSPPQRKVSGWAGGGTTGGKGNINLPCSSQPHSLFFCGFYARTSPPNFPKMALLIRNDVFSCFVFYGVLLVVKMYIIAIITGQVRLRKKVSAVPRTQGTHGRVISLSVWLSLMQMFVPLQRLLPIPRTRWDTEVCSTTERIPTWRDAGGERRESVEN